MRYGFKTTVSTVALLAATSLSNHALAQTPNTTPANVNVLNLLSPFLSLNGTAVGQQTLQLNLSQAIADNQGANTARQQLAISDKTLAGSLFNGSVATITLANGTRVNLGPGDNIAGGLPLQAAQSQGGLQPIQPVGGLGTQLGAIYQTGIRASTLTTGPLRNTYALLNNAYNFTSSDLGVAKNYFANGAATNPSTTPANYVPVPAVAPAGYTLPTYNGLPNTTDSVLDLAYGVTNKQAGQDVYGSSRPIQVAPASYNIFDPTALSGIATNPSFPSGHTNYAYTDGYLLAMLVPQQYQSLMMRASEYGDSRIVLGVHYPLDIIASRAFSAYDLAQAFTNPLYVNNAATTGTAINLPNLFTSAQAELQSYLAAQCGNAVATCAVSSANTTGNPYVPSAANQALYQQRLTYGLPTLSFTQAPREAAPAGGPDASILLATVYGGDTAAAKAIAPTGGLLGSLSTNTINQIIVNTETNAFAAFYGTALSYWTRIDLYTAAGYFQNVTGTLTLSSADRVTTNVTVGNGGTLAGTGTVASTTVASGGTLQPGAGAPGTLTVNGSLAFQSGALYVVQSSATAAASVTVTGTAALNGTVQVTSPTGASAFNTPRTILTSTSLNNSRFGSLTTATGVTGTLSYSNTTVQLNLTSALGQVAGNNANQRAVGTGLDNAFNASGSPGGLGAIFNGNVAQNLQQASGETATGTQQTTFNAMTQFLGVMTDPFIGGRGGAVTPPGAAGFAEEDDDALGYAARKARSGAARDAQAMFTKAPPRAIYEPRWSVWAAGYGGSQTTDGNAALGSNDTTSRVAAVAVGADYRFSPDTLAGFSMAGGGTSFSVNGFGTGRSDLFQAGAFIRHNAGPTYITGALAYGWQDITTDRTVTIAGIDQLRARFNADAFSGRVEGGYRIAAPWMAWTPYAAGQFTTFYLPNYAESVVAGANTFALNYGAKDVTATRSELGIRTDKSFAMDTAILTLRGRAAWAHDYNTDRSIGATFQSLPLSTFVVNGARQPSDLALVSAAAEWKWISGFSVGATFEGEFSDISRSYAGKGVVRYQW